MKCAPYFKRMVRITSKYNRRLCATIRCFEFKEDGATRFDTVCLDCPPWSECSGCTISRGNVTPECATPLEHTAAEEPGVTLETLNITRDYWRATNKSENILACFNADACSGGQTDADSFCAPGYTGPCEGGYEKMCEVLTGDSIDMLRFCMLSF